MHRARVIQSAVAVRINPDSADALQISPDPDQSLHTLNQLLRVVTYAILKYDPYVFDVVDPVVGLPFTTVRSACLPNAIDLSDRSLMSSLVCSKQQF